MDSRLVETLCKTRLGQVGDSAADDSALELSSCLKELHSDIADFTARSRSFRITLICRNLPIFLP